MKEIKENIKKVFASKTFSVVIVVFGILFISSIIFQAGVFVGFHKASFGRDWGENYGRNFGMMRGADRDFFKGGMMNQNDFPNAHGVIGKIIKIELPMIIIQDRDGTEKFVNIKDDTSIRSIKTDIAKSDLKIDDFVVVIGSPNKEGQIEAKLIRVMPAGIPNPPLLPQDQSLNVKKIQ